MNHAEFHSDDDNSELQKLSSRRPHSPSKANRGWMPVMVGGSSRPYVTVAVAVIGIFFLGMMAGYYITIGSIDATRAVRVQLDPVQVAQDAPLRLESVRVDSACKECSCPNQSPMQVLAEKTQNSKGLMPGFQAKCAWLREHATGQITNQQVNMYQIPEGFQLVQPFCTLVNSACSSNSDSAKWQKEAVEKNKHKKQPGAPDPDCDDVGICDCGDEHYFDGHTCLKYPGVGQDGAWRSPAELASHDFQATLRGRWGLPPQWIPLAKFSHLEWDDVLEGRGDDKVLLDAWFAVNENDTLTEFFALSFRGKHGIDIGCGLARRSMRLVMNGAHVTFLDVSPSNLKIVARIAGILGVKDRIRTVLIQSLKQLDADLGKIEEEDGAFEFISAFGSMHHAPRELIKREISILLNHARPGAQWIQLAYPVTRWTEYGSYPFTKFGDQTDRLNTPWGEWYEPGKLLRTLEPHRFFMNWCGHENGNEYVWFYMTYLGHDENMTIKSAALAHKVV